MKLIKNWANFWAAGWGILLLYELITSNGNLIMTTCIWISLVSIKSLLDMFHD